MTKKQNAIYFLATILAGVLNYYFQVFSAKNLTLEEFGTLNSWYAELSLVLFGGVFLQYYAALSTPKAAFKKLVAIFALCAIVVILVIYFYFSVPSYFNFIFAFGLGLLFSYFYGLAQIQMGFAIMGLAGLCVAGSKLLIPIVNDIANIEFYFKAITWSYVLGIVLLIPYILYAKATDAPEKPKSSFTVLAALILSLVTAVIPQLDILVVRNTQMPEIIGQFGYVSLLYKAFFFIFMIALQWYLPQQILNTTKTAQKTKPLYLLFGLIVFGFAAGLIAAQLYPHVLTFILKKTIEINTAWIVLSFLHITLLTYLFFLVQSYSINGAIKKAAVLTATSITNLIVFSLLDLPIEAYLLSACLIEAFVIFAVTVLGANREHSRQ